MNCIHTCIPTFTDNGIVGLGDVGTSTELFHIINKLLNYVLTYIKNTSEFNRVMQSYQ